MAGCGLADANREAILADGVHNHVNTRAELEEYDPDLASLIAAVLERNPWRWKRPRR